MVVGMVWVWSALVSDFQISQTRPSAPSNVRGSILPHCWQITGDAEGVNGPVGDAAVAVPMHALSTPAGLMLRDDSVVNHMT